MRFLDWFRPGIRIKRWVLLGILGIACISFGLSYLVTAIFLNLLKIVLSSLLIVAGIVFIVISIKYVVSTFFRALSSSRFRISLDSDRLSSMLYEKRILIKGPKIVTIGGGTGLSTMLRGLKAYSSNITAIVTVADDGGGSGALRQDLGMLPPGDIRNCVLALADTEPIMEQLLEYRFKEGILKGQSFGNLFLAAMDGISTNFEEAVRKMSDVLAVTGNVLPITLEDVKLCAELEDGYMLCGETNISKHNNVHRGRIKRVYLEPERVKPLQEALDALSEADILVLGPGSLYTSIIPNLIVDGISEEIRKSKAVKVYVCNIMTQPGETDGYSVLEHIRAIERHTYKGIISYCIVNTDNIPEELKKKYEEDEAQTVRVDFEEIEKHGINVIEGDFVSIVNNLIRHDADKLAGAVVDLVAETVLARDKKRIIDYYYVKDRLRRSIDNEQ